MKTFEKILYGCVGAIVTYIIMMIGMSSMPQAKYRFDLPEEISEATSNDTLIAIKQGRTISIQF